jgi:hypothetical protein
MVVLMICTISLKWGCTRRPACLSESLPDKEVAVNSPRGAVFQAFYNVCLIFTKASRKVKSPSLQMYIGTCGYSHAEIAFVAVRNVDSRHVQGVRRFTARARLWCSLIALNFLLDSGCCWRIAVALCLSCHPLTIVAWSSLDLTALVCCQEPSAASIRQILQPIRDGSWVRFRT